MLQHFWTGRRLHTLLLIVVILTALPAALAQENPTNENSTPTIKDVTMEIGENAIRYPQLESLEDATVQEHINDAIVEQASIAQRMVTLTTLQDGGTGLDVHYDAYLANGIFSTVISAKGILDNGRNGQVYTALTFDLTTGDAVALSDLFVDADQAIAKMVAIVESTYLDELSSYMQYNELTPLPISNFYIDADGITFYYPYRQFSLVSGYCGAAQFQFSELTGLLRTDADSLPVKVGIQPQTYSDSETKAQIEASVRKGSLPHIQATIGDAMDTLIQTYRLLREPDQYPGGRYFQLEAPMFRQMLVLSDALTSGWDASVVTGLLSFRADLYGIQTGVTPQTRWREILGTPTSTVAFDETMAFDYGLPVGTADYYTIGERQLLLYAGENGLLYAVRLT